jgi:hypothetical protein
MPSVPWSKVACRATPARPPPARRLLRRRRLGLLPLLLLFLFPCLFLLFLLLLLLLFFAQRRLDLGLDLVSELEVAGLAFGRELVAAAELAQLRGGDVELVGDPGVGAPLANPGADLVQL